MSDPDYERLAEEADSRSEARSPLEQAQRALGWRGVQLDTVMALFRLSVEWPDEESLLVAALHILEEQLQAEAGSVIMLDRQENDLYFAAATGPVSGDLKRYRLDRGEGIAGWCMESGRVIRIGDVTAEARWHQQISEQLGFNVRQIIAAPIRVRNRVIGCVELINKLGGAIFEREDEDVMAQAAECVGILFTLRGRRRS